MDGQALKRFVIFLRGIGFGHDGDLKAQLGGLFQAILTARCWPHLAGQADFAKGDEAFGQGLAAQTGGYGQHHGQVGRRFADAHAAYGVHKHVLVHAGYARVAVQHRQQHGQAVTVQAHRQAPGAGATAVHQGLNFHQQGARALQGHHHAAARHGFAVLAQKDGAGVAHALQAFFGHGEDADLVDRAEAVLDGADQPKVGMRVALKVQHRVHHMLQYARPGQGTFFGHMADQHNGGAGGFGGARQMRGAFTHLRHRAWGRGELVGVHRLNRVDDGDARLARLQGVQNFLKLDLGQHRHLAGHQT